MSPYFFLFYFFFKEKRKNKSKYYSSCLNKLILWLLYRVHFFRHTNGVITVGLRLKNIGCKKTNKLLKTNKNITTPVYVLFIIIIIFFFFKSRGILVEYINRLNTLRDLLQIWTFILSFHKYIYLEINNLANNRL